MTTYGYKTYKAHHFVAELRNKEGHSMAAIATAGSRQVAFRQVARDFKEWKIERFTEVDPADRETLERFGFIDSPVRPAQIDWSKLDLY